jgi:D-alanyl-D-alanine dipeptidase
MQENITLISDPKVLVIPIQDNGEPLVDLQTIPELFVDLSRENVQKKSANISFVRKSVAEMLVKAQKTLPSGYKFIIKEGHRDIETQAEIFNEYMDFLKKEFPSLSEQKLYEKASAYVAPPDIVPPHSTGGAVDLTLMTEDGKEIDMGTKFNADPEESDFSNYTNAPISEDIKEKREMLKNAMESVGFVNYPTEWWHWSYGDRYWAFIKGNSSALYGSITT